MVKKKQSALQRADVYYDGKVQGVGFRFATLNVARGYDVTGSVRNLPDGRVHMVAEGTKEEVEAFLTGMQESDLGGFIKEATVFWRDATGDFRGFQILRS